MARRKDLTALAALGTLGYMLSKRGDKKDDKKDDKKIETPSLENLPVARPSMKPNPSATAAEEQGKLKDSAYMAEYYASKPLNPQAVRDADNPRTEPIVTANESRTVSKKELADSGMSLRDFLNKERGLTRRKESKSSSPALIDPSNIRSGPRFDDEGLIDPSNIKSDRREFEESQKRAPIDVTKFSLKERFNMKKGGAVKGYASGGTVSSASKRADGIATKGKTRGKIC